MATSAGRCFSPAPTRPAPPTSSTPATAATCSRSILRGAYAAAPDTRSAIPDRHPHPGPGFDADASAGWWARYRFVRADLRSRGGGVAAARADDGFDLVGQTLCGRAGAGDPATSQPRRWMLLIRALWRSSKTTLTRARRTM